MRTKKLNKAVVKRKAMKAIWSAVRWLMIIGICYVILYPLFVKISVAFMSKSDMYDMTVKWVPRTITLDNFKEVLERIDYVKYFLTTLGVSALATFVQVSSCTLAGYGFARFRFRGNKILFILVIVTLVVPQQTYMVTTYMQYRYFDFYGILGLFGISKTTLIGTVWPVVLMSMGCQATKNGLFIYILRQFLSRLPVELEEAAFSDGAGVFKTFFKIMLPNAVPVLVTVSVLSFVWTWNDLYTASTYMSSMPLFSTLLNNLSFQISRSSGGMSVIDTVKLSMLTNAGALLIIAPLLIMFLLAQKFFVQGVERTGLTGM